MGALHLCQNDLTVVICRYIDQDQLIHDAMQNEAETTDQLLYLKYVEKNTNRGESLLADGIMEPYEGYMLSASGNQNSASADTYSYSKWLAGVVTV